MMITTSGSQAVVGSLLVTALLLVGLGQWLLLGTTPLVVALVPWVAGLALLVVLQRSSLPVESPTEGAWGGRPRPLTAPQPSLLLLASGAAILVAVMVHGREGVGDYTDVAVVWLVSMAALALAAGWYVSRQDWSTDEPTPAAAAAPRWEWWLAPLVVATALVLRLVWLDRYPLIVDADGMSQALEAVQFRTGELTNPFTTGFFGNPTLFPYLQHASMAVFGESVAGARAAAVAFGTASVLFTYLLARRLFGPPTAVIATAILAVVHGHLHFSRTSLNLVEDSFFLVVVLWLLDRGLVERRRLECVLAGLAVGLSQYFYFSARLIPLVAAATIVYLLWWRRRDGRAAGRIRELGGLVAWVAAGAVVAYLPLGVNYLDRPEDFSSRLETVSYFGSGSGAASGSTRLPLVDQARQAVLLPFETPPSGPFFHPDPPLVGWPLSVPAAAGLAVVTTAPWRRRQGVIALAWWGSIIGVGLTIGVNAQRWTIAWPITAIVVAVGIEAVGRVMQQRLGTSKRALVTLGAAVISFVMLWNVTVFFRTSNAVAVHGDLNTLVATELGKVLREEPLGTTVYVAALPRMSFDSHSTVPFLAPQVTGIDLDEPISRGADVPPIRGRTIFVFLPERAGELTAVRDAEPGGRTAEVRRNGEALFVTYVLERSA